MIDVLFVTPNSAAKAYQDLSKVFSAIEPPTWSLLLAEACRSNGFSVGILDADAERLSLDASIVRIKEINPRLIVFVLYGQNPNSGTTSMIGAIELAENIKSNEIEKPIAFVGSHTSALPKQVLAYPCVDFVLLNEGVYALQNLLRTNLRSHLENVNGIGYKVIDGDQTHLILNKPERVVPQERMDIDLPGYAWDLLPYREKPLDMYRSHFWHAGFDHEKRTPFAAIYTSLGCQFSCSFCMINIVNRIDNSDNVDASHSKGMRFWSSAWVETQLKQLAKMGVRTVRISDEMFFLNRKYYRPILQSIIDNEFDFNMWTYSRIDTVRKDALELFNRAGVNWLALGIEAGSQLVRKEVSKGSFKEVNIREICKDIQNHDINIISNYIFGLPEDTFDTMNETLDLALELNTETANFYPCQALPGSPLYARAKSLGQELPRSFTEFAFLSYDSKPLPTKSLTSADVLSFRDNAWHKYFTNKAYLSLVEKKFGHQQMQNVKQMTKIKLKRKILEEVS